MKVKLKQLRNQKGWTQPVAAVNLGLSLDAIKKIETNRSFVSERTLAKIYSTFECESFDEIFEAC